MPPDSLWRMDRQVQVQVQEVQRRAAVNDRFAAPGNSYPGKSGPIVRPGAGAMKKTTAPKRILIVEDNLDSVHALAFLLADIGHKVEYAINGYVGLEVARRFRPEFVLLDLGLPGLD